MPTPPKRTALGLFPLLLLGALLLLPPSLAQAGPARSEARLKAALQARRVANAKFEDVGLEDFVKWLRVATGHNIVIRRLALAKAGVDVDEVRITMTLEDITVANLLKLALEPFELATKIRGNVVYVTTRADALGKPITRLYPISHITWTKVDFIAPEINLQPSNFTPMEDYEPERIVEDDPLNTGDAVAELLQEIVAPGQWDTDGWGIRATDRYLVVRAPRTVHAKIDRALGIIASLK